LDERREQVMTILDDLALRLDGKRRAA